MTLCGRAQRGTSGVSLTPVYIGYVVLSALAVVLTAAQSKEKDDETANHTDGEGHGELRVGEVGGSIEVLEGGEVIVLGHDLCAAKETSKGNGCSEGEGALLARHAAGLDGAREG